MKIRFAAVVVIASAHLASCGGGGGGGGGGGPTPGSPPGPRNVTISWATNHEKGVNSAGGGYKVSITGQPTITVPWVSGTTAPTSTQPILLQPGTYTVTVTAFAALDAQGGLTGSVSAPSQSLTVNVP